LLQFRGKMGCGGSKADSTADTGVKAEDVKPNVDDNGKGGQPAGGEDKRRLTETHRRRVAVRGETQEDLEDDAPENDPSIPAKTDEEAALIRNGLGKSDLFTGLADDQIDYLVRGFVSVPAKMGVTVIQQGEQGDHFYLCESGRYDVSLSQDTEYKQEYVAGDCFGELALLYNSPRAATVKCSESGVLWALERKKFRHVMIRGAAATMQSAANFLKSVELLSPLSDEQRSQLGNVMEEIRVPDGQYIVKMGEQADSMFFIKSGEVVVHQGDEKGDMMRMNQGQFFGESCLEDKGQQVRKANIVAVGPTVVLKLSAQSFNDIIGDLAEVVEFNFKRKVLEAVDIDGTKVLDTLNPENQDKLLQALQEVQYSPGDKIITQGQTNDHFYIVKSGEVSVQSAEGKEIARLDEGQYFGERALLKGEPANATIVCSKAMVAYQCNRDTFTTLLGPLQELL